MIVTPTEAGQKYCPQMSGSKHMTAYCKADKCMAWKWLETPDPEFVKAYRRQSGLGMMDARAVAFMKGAVVYGEQGFCGLAVKRS